MDRSTALEHGKFEDLKEAQCTGERPSVIAPGICIAFPILLSTFSGII